MPSRPRPPPCPLAPIGPLVAIVEGLLPKAPKEYLPALMGIYWLYNCLIVPEHKRPDWEQHLQKADQISNMGSTERR